MSIKVFQTMWLISTGKISPITKLLILSYVFAGKICELGKMRLPICEILQRQKIAFFNHNLKIRHFAFEA